MKLYEINQAIEELFDAAIDMETGEILMDSKELDEKLSALEMEKKSILEYLAKLVLNIRSEKNALKTEEDRLKARRTGLGKKEERLMSILDRECGGEKTDLGVATVSYRATERVEVESSMDVIAWLAGNGHMDCYRVPEPEVNKTDVKKLLKAGTEIPGITLIQDNSCSLK